MAKILLVEDDNNLREIYEARLQAEGYTIVSANDGETALVVAKSEKPDLIISDVMMPKISGFEMLDILRNTDGLKDVKVIMLTALGQADDQARANQLGADRYLVKSQVTLEDIVKVSHELLEGSAPAAPAAATTAPTDDTTAPAPAEPAAPTEPTQAIPVSTPPTDAPAEAPDTPDTQSSNQEQTEVAKQIENFVASQPTEAPAAVEPSVTTEAPASPEVTTPETPPAATGESADQAADDKMLNNAVETLVAGAEPAPASSTPEPAAAPAEPPAPAEVETPAEESDAVPVAHKKVIKPLDSEPKPDLDALLAAEEAREQSSTPTALPEPVVGSASEAEQPSGAPTPPPSTQAETSGPDKPLDPNSIAL